MDEQRQEKRPGPTPGERREHCCAHLPAGALSDEELDNVSGGCGNKERPEPRARLGDKVKLSGPEDVIKSYRCPLCAPDVTVYGIVTSMQYIKGNWHYTLDCVAHKCPIGSATEPAILIPELFTE